MSPDTQAAYPEATTHSDQLVSTTAQHFSLKLASELARVYIMLRVATEGTNRSILAEHQVLSV